MRHSDEDTPGKLSREKNPPIDDATPIDTPLEKDEISEIELIELFFFAYRDFVGDADRVLETLGFGRAHHRALYFVNRRPALTVAELLDLLGITKQSLARVLKQLIQSGYIVQKTGAEDRRQRLLYPTRRGRTLIHDLSVPQSRRIHAALEAGGTSKREQVTAFLKFMRNEC